MITNAYNQAKEQVVILVDEYDAPLLKCPTECLDSYREIYSSFYINLKSLNNYIRFAFITGVTKFPKVSIFSTLNNLSDISLSETYATLCGITQDELTENFSPYIEKLASKHNLSTEECLAQLKEMYDGYHFNENSIGVYNPYSLINCFVDCKFDYYWFETGTPTFLVKKLIDKNFELSKLSNSVEIRSDKLLSYERNNTNIISALYQAGYLTIQDYDDGAKMYDLRFPNKEVERAFILIVRDNVFENNSGEIDILSKTIRKALDAKDLSSLGKTLKAFFASVPYTTATITEEIFRNNIFMLFKALGHDIRCEERTNIGRIDLTLLTKKYIYIIEIKKDKNAEDALKQINDKCYADKYALDTREVIKIGINYSSEKRNIDDFIVV